MKKTYLFCFLIISIFTNQFAIAQCTLSVESSAPAACSGDNVTILANAVGPSTALTTTLAAGNNHRGNMFDITATNSVMITSFDAHPMGNTTIEIYYKTGTWVGFANSPASWILVGSAAVTAQPMGTPTPVPVPVNITIPAGQTYAFYVTSTNTAVSLNYSNGTTVGAVYASDANISFCEGAGLEYPFTNGTGSTFTSRIWNGVIHYSLIGSTISYLWNTAEVTSSINSTISTSTQYSCIVNISGCPTLYDTTTVVVSVPPVDAGLPQTVCSGSSVTLSGSGAVSYTWDNGVVNGLSFTATSTTNYMVTGTDSIGCVGMDMVTVTVNSLPGVSGGSDQAVCIGSQTTLSGSGATSYSWDNGVSDAVPFSPSVTQSYIVTGTDANGCMNTDTVLVTVNNLPTVDAGPYQIVCEGSQIILSGSGAATYSWDNGVIDAVPFTASASIFYTVIGTDANGCINNDTVSVTINALPSVDGGTDLAVCIGTQVTLSGSGAVSYTWDNAVTDAVPFTPASTLSYIVTGTGSNGCVDRDTVLITVNNLPAVNAGLDQTVCAGSQITLSGIGASTYSWDNGVSDGVPFTPASTLTYIVTGTDVNGCMNTDTVTVSVNTVNAATTFLNETITASASGATYQWINCTSGLPIAGANSQSYTATVNGSYAVIVTMNGCSDTSVCQTINSVGISESESAVFSVYPNPTSAQLIINTGEIIADEISIMDVLGKTVLTIKPTGTSTSLNLSEYVNGVYLVRVSTPNVTKVIRVAKQQ